MKIADMLKLTAAGYTPAEIKELHALEIENPEALQLATGGAGLSDVKDLLALAASEDAARAEEAAPGSGESDQEPDYKKMYEELKQKSDEQADALKAIQNQNQRQDQSGGAKDPEEVLADIITNFM